MRYILAPLIVAVYVTIILVAINNFPVTYLTIYLTSVIIALLFRKRMWKHLWQTRDMTDALSPTTFLEVMTFMPLLNTVMAYHLVTDWIQWKRGKYPNY